VDTGHVLVEYKGKAGLPLIAAPALIFKLFFIGTKIRRILRLKDFVKPL